MLNVRDRSVWSPTDYALWFRENPPHRLETWDAALDTFNWWKSYAYSHLFVWQHFGQLVEKANTAGEEFTLADATLGAVAMGQECFTRCRPYSRVSSDVHRSYLIFAERCWSVLDAEAPAWRDGTKPVGDVGHTSDSADRDESEPQHKAPDGRVFLIDIKRADGTTVPSSTVQRWIENRQGEVEHDEDAGLDHVAVAWVELRLKEYRPRSRKARRSQKRTA